MKFTLRFALLILFGMAYSSCSEELAEIEWANVICNDLETDDDDLLKSNINKYLQSIDEDNTSILVKEFSVWLNDLECADAVLECTNCLNTDPPGSVIILHYVLDNDSLSKELVILSFEEANSIRLSDIR